jgi:hypothetical protein
VDRALHHHHHGFDRVCASGGFVAASTKCWAAVKKSSAADSGVGRRTSRLAPDSRRNGRAAAKRLFGSATPNRSMPGCRAFLERALLPRRMRFLQIDPDEFFCTEPLLFRELATRCRQCSSTAQCGRDLSDPSASPFDESWKDYCPNASMLSPISTSRSVGSWLPATAGSTASSMGGEQARAVIRH